MTLIARVIGVALLAAGLGVWMGYALFGRHSDWTGISFVLGCVGAIVGAIAGAAREIAVAQRQGHQAKGWGREAVDG